MGFLEHGLSADDWAPIKRFYADLVTLARIEQFAVVAVIMPVSDIADRVDHPYAREARTRLERLGIRYVDGFALRLDDDAHFLPQGADAHLNTDGYRVLAGGIIPKLARVAH